MVSGEKHLITGADGAAFAIVMARSGDGASMLLVDADNPGFRVTGHARTIDAVTVGGHCRVVLDDAFVPADAVLGEPGEGFRYAQVRLAPARLTHCMRWLGAARRAHEIAVERAVGREVFGGVLAEHGMAQALIADNEIDLAAARACCGRPAATSRPAAGAPRSPPARRSSSARRPGGSWTGPCSSPAASAPPTSS